MSPRFVSPTCIIIMHPLSGIMPSTWCTHQYRSVPSVLNLEADAGLEQVTARELGSPYIGAFDIQPGKAGVHFRQAPPCCNQPCHFKATKSSRNSSHGLWSSIPVGVLVLNIRALCLTCACVAGAPPLPQVMLQTSGCAQQSGELSELSAGAADCRMCCMWPSTSSPEGLWLQVCFENAAGC